MYQHLGNLPPDELAADPDYRNVLAARGDTWPLLSKLADRADAEVDGSKGVRFSFRWDLGTSRFIMIDSRNGRILDDGRHLMLGDREFGWVEQQMADCAVDHLVIGTSLPWLLPHALGDVQAEEPGPLAVAGQWAYLRGHREAQPHRVPRRGIRVLADDQDSHLIERLLKRPQHIRSGR